MGKRDRLERPDLRIERIRLFEDLERCENDRRWRRSGWRVINREHEEPTDATKCHRTRLRYEHYRPEEDGWKLRRGCKPSNGPGRLREAESSFMCSNPEMSFTIIDHVPNVQLTILLQATVHVLERAPVAVHQGQSGTGTDPEPSGRIGNESGNSIGNESTVRTRVAGISTICLLLHVEPNEAAAPCSIPEVTTVILAHRAHGFITMTGRVGILPGIDSVSAGSPVHGGNE